MNISAVEKETSVFNNILNKPDGTSLDQVANETHIVSPTVLENRIHISTDRAQPKFPCQQPQKQDDAYAAYPYPGKNEPSCSGVTQS